MDARATGTDAALDALTQAIITAVRPERIVLFGSRARGDEHEGSDYDIIVVLETLLPDFERTKFVNAAIGPQQIRAEIFVYTPAEFARKRDDVGTQVYAGECEGRVLYERPGSTIGRQGDRVREVPSGPPESFGAWLARAAHDFRAMEGLILLDDPLSDAVCFHAHAATEKLLKAVLVFTRVKPPRTHELMGVLGMCPATLSDDERVRDACAALEEVWPRSRYPNEMMPTPSEARASAVAARLVRNAVRSAGYTQA